MAAQLEGDQVIDPQGQVAHERLISCHNSPRRFDNMDKTSTNTRKTEMKTRLLHIIYTNPFSGLDHEDPYTRHTKFYELVSTLGASEAEEEAMFMRLFPNSLIGKANYWYI